MNPSSIQEGSAFGHWQSTSAVHPRPGSRAPQVKRSCAIDGVSRTLVTQPGDALRWHDSTTVDDKQAIEPHQSFHDSLTQSIQALVTALRGQCLCLHLMVMTSSEGELLLAHSTDLVCDFIPGRHPASSKNAVELASNKDQQEARQSTLARRKPIRKFVRTYPHERRRVVGGSGPDSFRGRRWVA